MANLENVVTVSDDSPHPPDGRHSITCPARWMVVVAAGALLTGVFLYFLRTRRESSSEDPLGRIEQMLEQAQDLIRRIESQFVSSSPEPRPS